MGEPTKDREKQDPQDKQFGAAAAEDQNAVDEMTKQGIAEDELSDEPLRRPRAGGKAEPEPQPAQSRDATPHP